MKLQKFFKPKPRGDPKASTHVENDTSLHHGGSVPVSPPAIFREHQVPRASAEDHWEVVSQGEDALHALSPRPHQQHFTSSVVPSRSSSLGSLPPGASPAMPNAAPNIPRSTSPFSVSSHTTNAQHTHRNPRERDDARKKPGAAALGLLKSLDPTPHHQPQQDFSEDHHTPSETIPIAREKREKRGFWEGVLKKERDRDQRDDDNGTAELTRMIGYLTATASEDWTIVLEVCERASANEANAKEAARALRREFKYAEPKSQLAAARLWAIMLRNASDVFLAQTSQRKFIDTVDEVLTSSRTSPVVRERLMEVLAAAAYITTRSQQGWKDKDKDGFRALWCRLKPADKPDAGIPFDTQDAMFSPPITSHQRPLSQYSLETPTFAQQTFARKLSLTPPPTERTSQFQNRSFHRRIIPFEEDIKRLLHECDIAHGNARVLSDTLAFAKPDALHADLIPEFLTKCRDSKELISAQIPWASAGAERSRAERALELARIRSMHGSHQDLPSPDDASNQLTIEEKLLATLLEANEALVGVLLMYDDLARIAIENATEERSIREVKMPKGQLDDQLPERLGTFTESSRASPPVPSPPTSPRQQFEMPIIVPSPNHPLPRIPPHHHSQATTPTLLAPPHPLGPRSPAQIVLHSRTPSPDRLQRSAGYNPPVGKEPLSDGVEPIHDASDSEEEILTPIRPSAKALGKRRVVDNPDAYDSSDQLHDRNGTASVRDSGLDSDSEEAGLLPKRPPTRYVYDAAAERTAQHLKEGRAGILVNGVH